MVRVAIVGCGGMGSVHFEVYKKLPDVEIVALVDIRREKAEEKAKESAIHVYTDIDEMLTNEKVDIVDICTPSYLHKELAIKAMKMGCHVLCEKPMALSSQDALEMKKVSETKQVYYMTAHVIRFWPEYRYLERILKEGTLGKVYHAHFSRIGLKPAWSWNNWMQDEKMSGRVLFDLHVHDADFIFKLFGTPKSITPLRVDEGENICYWHNLYQYNDFFVTAEASWYDCLYPFQMAFRVVFEGGIVEYKQGKLYVYEKGKEGKEIMIVAELLEKLGLFAKGGYENEIRYFIQCVKNNTPPAVITTDESIQCLEILESIKARFN
ncbi:MAG: Gfo/Idh/MocA family oxidoreductase [Bacilli bacterium]|nr:Gfo/Idh/MocA family oxidoreductase [Bacilli bacterium]